MGKKQPYQQCHGNNFQPKSMAYYLILLLVVKFPQKLLYCNGPLPFNGQLDADIVSAVTNADIVIATTVMHCDWVEAFQR
jgi:hypothetical protein